MSANNQIETYQVGPEMIKIVFDPIKTQRKINDIKNKHWDKVKENLEYNERARKHFWQLIMLVVGIAIGLALLFIANDWMDKWFDIYATIVSAGAGLTIFALSSLSIFKKRETDLEILCEDDMDEPDIIFLENVYSRELIDVRLVDASVGYGEATACIEIDKNQPRTLVTSVVS